MSLALFRFILTRYSISLMDVAHNLILITSYYNYSKLLMILFQNNDTYWKQHPFEKQCYLFFLTKYYIKVLFRQFTKTLNQFLYFTLLVQTKIWKLAYLFDLSIWKNKNSFEISSLHKILINGQYVESVKYHVR